jgi:hypothetical protein
MNPFALDVLKNAVKFSFESLFKVVTNLPVFGYLASIFADHQLKEKLNNGLALDQYIILTAVLFFLENILFGGLILKEIMVNDLGMSLLSFSLIMIVLSAVFAKLSNQLVLLSAPYYLAMKIYLNK